MRVPYINLGLQYQEDKSEILQKMEEVLDSGMFILGDEVKQFEESFAKICRTKYAIGVANGTDGLMLSLRALGIGPGDEVITAPNSYLASASSIALIGAKIVFADVGDDYNLDPKEVAKKINKNTKAIIAVHLTGRPAKMDELQAIADEHGISIIEDAAQAVGAMYKGKPVGSLGKIASFSLHPLKNLAATGDAGMITTNDQGIYDWLMKARTHGMKSRDECEFWSINSRLDSLHAAILNVKVKRLEAATERRRAIASKYREALKDLVWTPNEEEFEKPVYHTFIIMTSHRDALQKYLMEKGVDTKVHYPIAIHQQEAFTTEGINSFPKTEKQIQEILSLPVYPELTDDQVGFVIQSIQSFFD